MTADMVAEMHALFREAIEVLGASGRVCRLAGNKAVADRCEWAAERMADFLAAVPTVPTHDLGGEG